MQSEATPILAHSGVRMFARDGYPPSHLSHLSTFPPIRGCVYLGTTLLAEAWLVPLHIFVSFATALSYGTERDIYILLRTS